MAPHRNPSLELSIQFASKLKGIRLLLLDVDGVLTDGQIFWQESCGWTRHFSIQDGYGLKQLKLNGIQLGIISGSDSIDIQKRAERLALDHVHLGTEDKIGAYLKILALTGFTDSETAYMGDDLFDLPVLTRVGFSATVPQAHPEVKTHVHHITEATGGKGAVREICDAILYAQNKMPSFS